LRLFSSFHFPAPFYTKQTHHFTFDDLISDLSGADAKWAAPGVFRIYGAFGWLAICLSFFVSRFLSYFVVLGYCLSPGNWGAAGLGSNEVFGRRRRAVVHWEGGQEGHFCIIFSFELHILGEASTHSRSKRGDEEEGVLQREEAAAVGSFDDITRLLDLFLP
jgi:hypothetical protein